MRSNTNYAAKTQYTSTDGAHSHTINDHTHSWGGWSGGSCYLGTDTGRDYVDGSVVWNGSQYVGKDWTGGSCYLGTDTNRDWTDGSVWVDEHNQGHDRSYTEMNSDVNNQESRPRNLTIRIWRRKA